MTPAEIVNAWFQERLRGGPLGRDTEAFNQVNAALPDLIARLTPPAAPAPEPETPPAPPAPAVDLDRAV